MKIVMVGPFGMQPKGTMKVRALPMARALVKRGHSVSILIPPWDHPVDSGQEWEDEGVMVVNVTLPPTLPVLSHLILTLTLVRRALALRPEVVHCFKPKSYAGLTHFVLHCLQWLGLVDRNLILVVDEDDWEQAWNQAGLYSPALQRFFAWQEQWGLRHADAVVVASRELIHLTKEEGVAETRIHYVPNGANNPGEESPDARPQAVRMLWELDDAPVVLLYSRFLEFRLERIRTILASIATRYPDAKLLILGEGLHSEEADLDDLLREAGLAENSVLTGWVESAQLPDHFAVADVAIFPYDDTLINRTKCSVKLIDLLTAGLPVVADAVGQNVEYILDEQTGLLVQPEDDAAMADAVVRLLSDPDLRTRLGERAACRMREEFGWDKLVLDLEPAYR